MSPYGVSSDSPNGFNGDSSSAEANAVALLHCILGDAGAEFSGKNFQDAMKQFESKQQQFDSLLERVIDLKIELQKGTADEGIVAVTGRETEDSKARRISNLEKTVRRLKLLAYEDEKRQLRTTSRISELNRRIDEQTHELQQKDQRMSRLLTESSAFKPSKIASDNRLAELRSRRKNYETNIISKVNQLKDDHNTGDSGSQFGMIGTATTSSEESIFSQSDDFSALSEDGGKQKSSPSPPPPLIQRSSYAARIETPNEILITGNTEMERLQSQLSLTKQNLNEVNELRAAEQVAAKECQRKSEDKIEHLKNLLKNSKKIISKLSASKDRVREAEVPSLENAVSEQNLERSVTESPVISSQMKNEPTAEQRQLADEKGDKALITDELRRARAQKASLQQKVGQLEKLVGIMEAINKEMQSKIEETGQIDRRLSIGKLATELKGVHRQLLETQLGIDGPEKDDKRTPALKGHNQQLIESGAECTAMKGVIKEQEMHLSILNSELSELRDKLKISEVAKSELERKLADIETEDHEFKLVLEDVQLQLFGAEEKNKRIEEELERLRNVLDESSKKGKQMELDLRIALRQEGTDSIDQSKRKDSDARLLESLMDDLQNQVAFMEEKNVMLQSQIRDSEAHLSEANKKISIIESQSLFFESDDDFASEIAIVKQDNEKKERLLEKSELDIQSLRGQLTQLRNEKGRIVGDLHKLQEESSSLISRLEAQNRDLEFEVQSLRTNVAASSRSLMGSQNAMREAHQEVEYFRNEVDQMHRVVKEKEGHIDLLQAQLGNVQAAQAVLSPNGRNPQLEAEIENLKYHVAELKKQNDVLLLQLEGSSERAVHLSPNDHDTVNGGTDSTQGKLEKEIQIRDLKINELQVDLDEAKKLLSESNSQKQSTFDSSAADVHELEATLQEIQHNMSTVLQDKEMLEAKLEAAEQRLLDSRREFDKRLATLQDHESVEDNNTELEKIRRENQNLSIQLEEARELISEKQRRQEIADSVDENDVSRELEQANIRVHDTELRCKNLELSLDEKQAEVTRLQGLEQHMANVTREKELLSEELRKAESEVQDVNEARRSHEALLKDIESLRTELAMEKRKGREAVLFATRVDDLEAEVDRRDTEIQSLRDEVKILREQHARNGMDGEKLKSSTPSTEDRGQDEQRQFLQEKLEALRKSEKIILQKEDDNERLHNELNNLQSKLIASQTSVEDLKQELKYSRAKLYELSGALNARSKSETDEVLQSKCMELAETTAERDQLRAKLSVLQSRSQTLEEESKMNQGLVKEMSQSWSSAKTKDQNVERLQQDYEESLKRTTNLSVELAESRMKIDQLTKDLSMSQKDGTPTRNGANSPTPRSNPRSLYRTPSKVISARNLSSSQHSVNDSSSSLLESQEALIRRLTQQVQALEGEKEAYETSLVAVKRKLQDVEQTENLE